MKDKVLITSTALMAIAVAVYVISLRIGGGFYDFCSAAKNWVILGIITAFVLTYFNTNKQTEKGK